jgi:hypothetical protein
MKLNCSYSVAFNGKKFTGRPANAFNNACKELQNVHAGSVKIFATKDMFSLVLYRDDDAKFLGITSAEGVTITQNDKKFDFVIPAKLAESGPCQEIVQGYKNYMKINIQITLADTADKNAFELLIKNIKQQQSAHKSSSSARRDSTSPNFCPNFSCLCQFCLIKKQKQKHEYEVSLERIKDTKIVGEKLYREAEVKQIIEKEREYYEEQLQKQRQTMEELFDELREKEEKLSEVETVVEKTVEVKNHLVEQLQKQQQNGGEEFRNQKKVYERKLSEAKDREAKMVQTYELIIDQLRDNFKHLQRKLDERPRQVITQQPQEQVRKVFITISGNRFHAHQNCSGLSGAIKKIECDSDRIPSKFSPCKFCYPQAYL